MGPTSGPYVLEVDLLATDVAAGQIALLDLGRVAASMHELGIRVGRLEADQRGTGRSFAAVERAAGLRVTGIRSAGSRLGYGGTTLVFEQGAVGTLPIEDDLERATFTRLVDVLRALRGAPPAWVTALVKESALDAAEALRKASYTVLVRAADRAAVSLDLRRVDRDAWAIREETLPTDVEVAGVLEAVDLRSKRFRLRDASGNGVVLSQVVDIDRAATLIARHVIAQGRPVFQEHRRLVGIEEAELRPSAPPSE